MHKLHAGAGLADQDPPQSKHARALLAQQEGNHVGALALFLQAVEEGDESVALYLSLSHTHAALGQFPEAQDACTLAMQSQSDDPGTRTFDPRLRTFVARMRTFEDRKSVV